MTENQPQKVTMTCSEFQERLPELFETHQDMSAEDHLKTCEQCSALVRDLQYIAQQAKLLLPLHDPSPAVWDNIQSAMDQETPDSTSRVGSQH